MKPASPKHAVIYGRVSSVKQVREGDGLRSQEARCREYAGYRGLEVVGVFADEASGSLVERPQMKAMLAFLSKRCRVPHAVIIDDISRLARGVEAHIELRAAIARVGAILESPSISFGDDADSELQEYMLATVAQHQRRKNAEQTKNRMKGRASNGYWVTRAPIGYRYERVAGHGKLLVRDEPTASIIAEGIEGYASGRFQTVAELTRFFETFSNFPRNRQGYVHFERVVEILSRSVYAGHLNYPEWGIVLQPGKHEALVSLATWQAAQERRLGKPKVPSRADLNDAFPLRGFVTCGDCGEPFTACWSKGRNAMYPYYLCDTPGCSMHRKSVRKEILEGEFETLLMQLRPTEGLFAFAFEVLRDLWDAKLASKRSESVQLAKSIKDTERKLEQLLDRLVEADSATLIKAYEKRIADLEMDKAIAREKIAQCGRPLASFRETYRTAFDFLANPCSLWNSPHLEDRRAVLKLVFAEPLAYVRGEGYRTAEISMPFKLLGGIDEGEKVMVPRGGTP